MNTFMIWVLSAALKAQGLLNWGDLLFAILGALVVFILQKIRGKNGKKARNLALVIRNDLAFLRASLKTKDVNVVKNLGNGIKSVSLWENLALEATNLLPFKLVQSISSAYEFINVILVRGLNIESQEFQTATSQYFVSEQLSKLNKTIAELDEYCKIKTDNDNRMLEEIVI